MAWSGKMPGTICVVPSGQKTSSVTGAPWGPSPKCSVRSFWLHSPDVSPTCRVRAPNGVLTMRTWVPIAALFTVRPLPSTRTFSQWFVFPLLMKILPLVTRSRSPSSSGSPHAA